MIVKICGITTLAGALAAVECGADMLGFNFYAPSARYVTPPACAQIVNGLHRRGITVRTVGVFVNAGQEAIAAVLQECGLDLAQLHGDEPPELLAALGERAFKAVRPDGAAAAERAGAQYARPQQRPALLVDAARPGVYGGSGCVADWGTARQVAAAYPILLAGGLSAANVAAAIAQVRPWGVDVASGVENRPGEQDPEKMAAFVAAVRAASAATHQDNPQPNNEESH